jgi:hypothetical protein
VSNFYTWEGPIPATPGQLLRQEKLAETLGLAAAAVDLRILYSSTNGIDRKTPVAVSGLLFLPKGAPPKGGWPLLAWAHGTAGMADICAPSWAGSSLRVEAIPNAWLEHGFAIVATDYQGLGTPGPHPYLATRPAAYDVLDSIRAVQQAFPAIAKETVLDGYSQGAAAVLGAGALAPSYAPGLDVRGIIATGVPYVAPETVAIMRQNTADRASYTRMYPLYLGLMAQQFDPILKASDMFTDKALPLFELTRRACVWQLALEALASGLTRAESVKPGYAKALAPLLALREYPSLKLPQPVYGHRRGGRRRADTIAARACEESMCRRDRRRSASLCRDDPLPSVDEIAVPSCQFCGGGAGRKNDKVRLCAGRRVRLRSELASTSLANSHTREASAEVDTDPTFAGSIQSMFDPQQPSPLARQRPSQVFVHVLAVHDDA